MSETPDQFTLTEGDLQVTLKVEGLNPYGYSYSKIDGETVYFDDDGERVNSQHRPITEDDLGVATRAFKMGDQSRDYLEELAQRYGNDSRFAGAVIAKAARRALKGTANA